MRLYVCTIPSRPSHTSRLPTSGAGGAAAGEVFAPAPPRRRGCRSRQAAAAASTPAAIHGDARGAVASVTPLSSSAGGTASAQPMLKRPIARSVPRLPWPRRTSAPTSGQATPVSRPIPARTAATAAKLAEPASSRPVRPIAATTAAAERRSRPPPSRGATTSAPVTYAIPWPIASDSVCRPLKPKTSTLKKKTPRSKSIVPSASRKVTSSSRWPRTRRCITEIRRKTGEAPRVDEVNG